MFLYTPAELKAIAGQMGKGTITDELYLVLRNRTILQKTPRGRKKQHRVAATVKPPTTNNNFSPSQNTAGTEQLSTTAVKDKVTTTNDHISPFAVIEENATTDNTFPLHSKIMLQWNQQKLRTSFLLPSLPKRGIQRNSH